jgi:methylase-S type I restriction modification domain containing protein
MSKKDNVAAVPKYRFPEFALDASIDYVAGGFIFDPITNRNHHADLPILAITQEYGAIPRDEIDYKVSVTKKSLKAYKIVEKGDFIISLRSFQGGIEYSMYDGICSPAYIILRKKTNIIDQYYKYYFKSHRFIQDLNKDLEGIRDGKMISYGQFSSILLPKPDEEEQQKVVDCLSSIDDLISVEEKKLSLLNDYKKGWMQKLFPAEGKTVPEWRFPEFKDDNNWKCVEIETVGKVITGKTPPTSNDSLWNGSIQFVTPTDIVGDKYQRLVQRTVVKISNMKVLPKGTIMFTCIASVGKMAISVYPCVTNQQINSIITKKGYYNEFIYYSLFRNVNKIKSGLSNTTVPIINKTDFSKIQISVTLNEKEQQKIANFLSGIDDLISTQADRIEALKQHKKALMQGLFPAVEEVWK